MAVTLSDTDTDTDSDTEVTEPGPGFDRKKFSKVHLAWWVGGGFMNVFSFWTRNLNKVKEDGATSLQGALNLTTAYRIHELLCRRPYVGE
jgi:hypothetical protein